MSTPTRELSTQAVAGYLAAHGIVFPRDFYLGQRAVSNTEKKEPVVGILGYHRYDPSKHRSLYDFKRLEDARAYVTNQQGERCRLVNHSGVLDPAVGIGENVDLVAGVCNYSGKHKELGIGDKLDVTV